MFFTACEKSSPQQIDPSEEFGGIMFGMTQDEIISLVGKEPDIISSTDDNDLDDYTIWYMHEEYLEECFNISDVHVVYWLKKDDNKLCCVDYSFYYNGQKQFKDAYETVKAEILRRYPGDIQIDSRYNNYVTIKINTENRHVVFYANEDLYMNIQINEYRPGIDPPRDIDEE